jgi:serine/threonine protein kinase
MSSPLAANTVDAAALADEFARLRIIEPGRLTELLSDFSGGGPVALAEFLVRRGVLTVYQAERALAGESKAIVLGPYRLSGLAGPGTFGPVYTATHRDRKDLFRLRVFPLRSLWRARQAKQLARTLAASPHPVVSPLIDADSANGHHYLVWPHVEGVSLADRVGESGPIPAGEVVGLLAYLAEALHACHLRKLYHGTLTPRSIVLGDDGLPRLLELGAGAVLAANLEDDESLLDTLSAAVAVAGVLEFAAPEFALLPTQLTPELDQYALGAIGYYALTGNRAGRPGGSPVSLDPEAVELEAVIGRMMSPDPAARFSALDEVRDRLLSLSGLPEPVAREVSAGEFVPPASIPLSSLQQQARASGIISWTGAIGGGSAVPHRDDSDASVTFELPDPASDAAPWVSGQHHLPALPSPEPLDLPAPPDTPRHELGETESVPSLAARSVDRPSLEAGIRDVESLPARSDELKPEPLPEPLPEPSQPSVGRKSSVRAADLQMARPQWPDPFEGEQGSIPASTVSDPRKNVAAPVQYHTEQIEDSQASASSLSKVGLGSSGNGSSNSVRWKRLRRKVLFWQNPRDIVCVSVFGPQSIAPGQSAKLSVYLHSPDAADSVLTLSRAFHHDSELVGSGRVSREIERDSLVAVHLSVTNAGISRSLLTFVWRGQPQHLVFDLHVPWESPSGAAPGLVSIGRDNVRIGKIDFHLKLLPRKG